MRQSHQINYENMILKYSKNDSHKDRLINSDHPSTREKIAKQGDKKHLDKLVHDEDYYVKTTVAAHRHKEHLDKLVNDKDVDVLRYIARIAGHKEHVEKLANHPNKYVKDEAEMTKRMSGWK